MRLNDLFTKKNLIYFEKIEQALIMTKFCLLQPILCFSPFDDYIQYCKIDKLIKISTFHNYFSFIHYLSVIHSLRYLTCFDCDFDFEDVGGYFRE